MDQDGIDLRLVIVVVAASAGLWFHIGGCLLRGQPVLHSEPRTSPGCPPLVVALALLLIGYTAWESASRHFSVTAPAPEQSTSPDVEGEEALKEAESKVSLEAIQGLCAQFLLMLLVLGGLLVVFREGRLADYGLGFAKWPSQLVVAVGGFLASLLPVYAIRLMTLPWQSPETQHPLLVFIQENRNPQAIAWVALAVAVLAPLTEELQYRVILQGWLRSLLPARFAIPIAAIVFSLVHGFPDAIGLLPLALILGYVYDRRGSYLAVVALHGLFNALNLAVALAASGDPPGPVASWFGF